MNLSPLPIQKFFDNNGRPLVGGLLFTYVAGTSTKVATYIDSSGGAPNTNPVVLDFRGECRLWIDPQLAYKFILAPANDTDPPTNPTWTVDDITAGPSNFDNSGDDVGTVNNVVLEIPSLMSVEVFTRVSFKAANTNTGPTTLSINGGPADPLIWPNGDDLIYADIEEDGIYQAIFDGNNWQLQGPNLYGPGDIRRYGVVGDGATDDSDALQRALTVGGALTAPGGLTVVIARALTCTVAKTSIDFGNSVLAFSAAYDDEGTNNLLAIVFTAADVEICNVQFDGSAKAGESNRNGVFQFNNNSSRASVHDCRFVSLGDGGSDVNCAIIYLNGADDCEIYSCTFHDCPGAGFSQGARTRFQNCVVTQPKDVSFALNGPDCRGGSVRGCKLIASDITVSGHIAAEEGACDWVFTDNYISGVKDGGGIAALTVAYFNENDGGIIANNIIDGGSFTTTAASSLITVSQYYRNCKIVNNLLRGMPDGLAANAAITAPALGTLIQGNRIDATTGTSSVGAVVIRPAGGQLEFTDNFIDCTGGPARCIVFDNGDNDGFPCIFSGGSFLGATTAIDTDLNDPVDTPIWLINVYRSSCTNFLVLTGTDSIETFFNTGNAWAWPHSIKSRRVCYGDAAPTAGTWSRGDTVWNLIPSAAGTPGWICTADGTPGTWKAMANIAA